MSLTPPWNQLLPVAGGVGFAGSWSATDQVAPPSVDSYSAYGAASGGVRRPPFTDDEPWRATSVPMYRWLEFVGSMAIAPIESLLETGQMPATRENVEPPSVDLNRPTPASES